MHMVKAETHQTACLLRPRMTVLSVNPAGSLQAVHGCTHRQTRACEHALNEEHDDGCILIRAHKGNDCHAWWP